MILGIVLIIILLLILASCLKIVPQAHAYVIERLGAYQGTWSVGFHIKMPIIDKVAKKVILKEQVVDFAPQPVQNSLPHLKTDSQQFPMVSLS